MTDEQYARIERAAIMRESGATYREIGTYFGVPAPTVRRWLNAPASVDVAPFREAFERSQQRAIDVAARIGWKRPSGHPDGRRVLKALGLVPHRCGKSGVDTTRQRVRYDTALRLCEGLGVDPVDVGF